MANEPKSTAAAPGETSKDNPYAQYHEVKKGETLSKIAERYYGDPMLYPKIFEANRDLLDDPDRIYPGQRLLIP